MDENLPRKQPFNAMYHWLGVPLNEQPPTSYRLLGLSPFESDPDVIEHAADRQMAHVRLHQSGRYAADSQALLNTLATAKLLLLDPKRKAAYDEELRASIKASTSSAESPKPPVASALPPPPPAASEVLDADEINLNRHRSTVIAPTKRGCELGSWLKVASVVAVIAMFPAIASLIRATLERPLVPKRTVAVGSAPAPVAELAPVPFAVPTPRGEIDLPSTPAVIRVAGMHPVAFVVPPPGIVPSGFPKGAIQFIWDVVPTAVDMKLGATEITVDQGGQLFIEANWDYEGNNGGGWYEERLTKEQLIEQGWRFLGPCPWNGRNYLFCKTVNTGDSLKIRTNKYWPPMVYVADSSVMRGLSPPAIH